MIENETMDSARIFKNKYLRIPIVTTFLLGLGIFFIVLLFCRTAKGDLVATPADEAPSWIRENSSQVVMMNITAYNNSQGAGNAISSINVSVTNVQNFDPTDELAALANDATSGVSIYQESNGQSGFQTGDTRIGTQNGWYGMGPTWNVNFTFTPSISIPSASPGEANFYIIVRTSGNLDANDQFKVTVNQTSVVSTFGSAPGGNTDSSTTEGDTQAPTNPSNFQFTSDGDSGGDGIIPEVYFNDDWEIDLSWDGSSDPGTGSGISHYRIGVNWGTSSGEYAEDDNYMVGADGNYTLYICAVDGVGHNSSEVEMADWVICNTTLPNGTVSITEQSDVDYIYFDLATYTLYYTDHAASFNISAAFDAGESNEKEVKFGSAFDQGVEYTDDSSTYDSNTYAIVIADTDTLITVKFVDRAGNVGYNNITCEKDTWGPTIISPIASESSIYLYINGSQIWYGDDMAGAESFTLSGSGNDSQSGLWKMTFPNNALGNPGDDNTPATWQGIYNSVENGDSVTGALTITLYDLVNNQATFSYTLVRDTSNPTIDDGDWSEADMYLYVDTSTDNSDNTIYYSNLMGEVESGTLSLTFSDDQGLHNVTYSSGVGVDQAVDVISGISNSSTAVYGFDSSDVFSNTITVTVVDKCGNALVDSSTFTITRDTAGPSVDSQDADENSPYLHVSGTTIYYSDLMVGNQAFNVTGTSSDSGAGLFKATFSSNDLGSPGEDGAPGGWSGTYNGVGSADTWEGTITVTFYDMVNNTNTCTYTVTRDNDVPGMSVNFISESSDHIDFNNDVLYFSSDQAMSESFTIEILDTEGDSGRASAQGETEFGDSPNDNSYGAFGWELTYTIDQGETCGGNNIIITVYDNVGNSNSTILSVQIDNVAPICSLLGITESSSYIYISGNILYYSNDQAMDDVFNIRITDDESGSGREKADGETAFGETPSDNSYNGGFWQITYTISQGETCDGEITITVYDNCGNTGTYNLTVVLDNTAPTLTIDDVSITGDNIYYSGGTLYFSNDQGMADIFEIRINDTEYGAGASGRQNASGESAFGNTPTDNSYSSYWSLQYTINQDETCDGSLIINVSDNCGNWNTTILTVTIDNGEPALSDFAFNENIGFQAWGENWFDPAVLSTMEFTWTNSDGVSGLGKGNLDWDSSHNPDDNPALNSGTGGSYTVLNLADDSTGNITVTLYIYDNVNNVNTSVLTFNFDSDDPSNLDITGINEISNGANIYYDTGTDTLYYNSSIAIEFHIIVTFDEVGSGRNKTVGPNLFGDTPENSTYAAGHYLYYTIEISASDSGVQTVTVYDNIGRSDTITFTVVTDNTAPTVSSVTPVEVLHTGNLYFNNTSEVFYYNNGANEPQFAIRIVTSDAGSGREQCVGQALFGDNPTDAVYTTYYEITYSVELGASYNGTVNVTIYDRVNNHITVALNVKRDVYAPHTPQNIKADPDGLGTYLKYDDDTGIYLYWDFTTDDAGGSDIYYYFADVNDNTPQTAVTQGHDYHSASAPEGNNTFYVWVADNVGNYCPVGSDWIIVDTGAPTITGITVSSNKTWYYSAGLDPDTGGDVWFNSNMNQGQGQIITLTFTWNDGYRDYVNCSGVFGGDPDQDTNDQGGWTLDFQVPQGAGDRIAIIFWVVDMAKNNDTVQINFYVDNNAPTAPQAVRASPNNNFDASEYTNSSTVWVVWADSAGDAGVGLKEHRMGISANAMDNDIHNSGDSVPGQEGLETFYVYAIDLVGNNISRTDTITIDLTNPVITQLTVSSTSRYYYNQSLGTNGGTVWFNSMAGMGADQELTLYFSWTEANKANITGSSAFGDSPFTDSIPWTINYTVEAGSGDQIVNILLKDLSGRLLSIQITFLEDNEVPTAGDLVIGDDSSPYVYFDQNGNVLYYSREMNVEQLVSFQLTAADDQESGVANVTFPGVLEHNLFSDDTAPYARNYGFNRSDNYEGTVIITLYDNVGNHINITLDIERDLAAPVWEGVEVGESSNYLFYNSQLERFYYSHEMETAQEFHVLFRNAEDNLSGMYGLNHSTFQETMEMFTGMVYNLSFMIEPDEDMTGPFTFVLHDRVNNTAEWSFDLILDTEIPMGGYDIEEISHFLHFDGESILFYGDDMASLEEFKLMGVNLQDNHSGIAGMIFPDAFDIPALEATDLPLERNYSVGISHDLTGIIEIIIFDNTYNMRHLYLTIAKDTSEPLSIIEMTDMPSYMHYDPSTETFFYSDEMPGSVSFTIRLSNAIDNESGIFGASFPAMFGKISVFDQSPNYSTQYSINEIETFQGMVNITVRDNVGNELILPLVIIRDVNGPVISLFSILENSNSIYFDGSSGFFYNTQNMLTYQDFTVIFDNVSDELSGFYQISYPALFSTPDNITQSLNYTYRINISDSSKGNFVFKVYDNVGNSLDIVLKVISDTDAPVAPGINITENEDHIYFDLTNKDLWYSNKMGSAENFTLNIYDLLDMGQGSGIYGIMIPGMFDRTEELIPYTGENISVSYMVRSTSSFNGTVPINVYDNVNNVVPVLLKIKLDNEIEFDKSGVTVHSEDSDRIYFDHEKRILYYGDFNTPEEFRIEFELNSITEIGAGFLDVQNSDIFSLSQYQDLIFTFTVDSQYAEEGDFTFRVMDRVHNYVPYTINIVRDTVKPAGTFLLNGKEMTSFSSLEKKKFNIEYDLSDDISGVEELLISNDGSQWKKITLSLLDGETKWDITDEQAGGNTTEGERTLYIKVVDHVGNENVYTVEYKYTAPVKVSLFERLPFLFGVFGFLGPWGLLLAGLAIVGLVGIAAKRRKKDMDDDLAEDEGDMVLEEGMGPTPYEIQDPKAKPEIVFDDPYMDGANTDAVVSLEEWTDAQEDEEWTRDAEKDTFVSGGVWDEEDGEDREEENPWDDDGGNHEVWDNEEGEADEDIPLGEDIGHELDMDTVGVGKDVLKPDMEEEPPEEIVQGELIDDSNLEGEIIIDAEVVEIEDGIQESPEPDTAVPLIQDDDHPEEEKPSKIVEEQVETEEPEVLEEEELPEKPPKPTIIGDLDSKADVSGKTAVPNLELPGSPSLCVSCNGIIKKDERALRCPNCSKYIHPNCGDGLDSCPECGIGLNMDLK